MIQDEIKTPWGMLAVVANMLKMDMADYKVKIRSRYYTDLRRIGALLLRRTFPMLTLSEIGAMYGGFDHSTVINYITSGYGFLMVKQQPFLSKYVVCEDAVEEWLKDVDEQLQLRARNVIIKEETPTEV